MTFNPTKEPKIFVTRESHTGQVTLLGGSMLPPRADSALKPLNVAWVVHVEPASSLDLRHEGEEVSSNFRLCDFSYHTIWPSCCSAATFGLSTSATC